MLIIPAIEIREGKIHYAHDTRRRNGSAKEILALMSQWKSQKARFVHIYDGDAAAAGHPCNQTLYRELTKANILPIQVKGGIRCASHAEEILGSGVFRVVLDENVLADRQTCQRLFAQFGGGVAASLRSKNGKVMVTGWPSPTNVDAVALVEKYKDCGLETVIYKDLMEDGSPDLSQLARMKAGSGLSVIASGGITSLREISAMKDAELDGAIISTALLDGSVNLKNAMAFAR